MQNERASAIDRHLTVEPSTRANRDELIANLASDTSGGSHHELLANNRAMHKPLDIQALADHITFDVPSGTDIDGVRSDNTDDMPLDV